MEESKNGFLSSIWKAHSTITKYLSFKGVLFWAFITTAAATTGGLVASPNLLDVGTQFYSTAFNNIASNFLPGMAVLGKATVNTGIDAYELITE